MCTGRVRLLLVGWTLCAATTAFAIGPVPTSAFMGAPVPTLPPVSKRFPFDPHDQRPAQRGADGAYADPVHGRPGLVVSPYAPDAGYVDVRAFKYSDEARCPYTGKIFLVP